MKAPRRRGGMPPAASQVDKMLRRALDRHRAGDRDEAERLYADILRRDPSRFDAAYLLAASATERGAFEAALSHLAVALALRPADPAGWRLRGIVFGRLGRHSEALAAFDAALAALPDSAELHVDRGTVLQALGRPTEALTAFDLALGRDPGLAQAHNNRGNVLSALGRDAEALASYDAAIARAPNVAESHNNRGNALKALQRSGAALESFDRALRLAPGYAAAHSNRGTALHQLGRFAEALASHDAAIAAQPGFATAHHNRAATLADLGRLDEALQACEAALGLAPSDPAPQVNRGTVLKRLGRYDDALAAYAAAGPDHAQAMADRGLLLVEMGRVPEGCAALERALLLAPRDTQAFHTLTQCRRFAAGDPLLSSMQALATTGSLPTRDRIDLHFGLGKGLGDIGRHDEAFAHLEAGNRLQRARTRYDEAATLAGLHALRRAEAVQPSGMTTAEPAGPRPIFILGMPRSGSTLVEQVLAGHPDVFAAGETDLLARVLSEQGEAGRQMLATGLLATGEAEAVLWQAGLSYRDQLAALAPGARAVTNKLPDNFRLVGLIRLMLPDARIVHTRRHPLDTCLSCYATRFTGHQPYSYDLPELGRYYRAYAEAMAHWRETLPPGVLLEVDYERMVDDLEAEARRILGHCGLAWNPACLAFQQVRRPVFTASFGQVREGLNRRSVARWRAYAKHLGPLREALGALGSDEVPPGC